MAVTDGPYGSPGKQYALADNPQVKRTRQILLILIGVILAICVSSLGTSSGGLESKDNANKGRHGLSLGNSIISIIYYAMGFHLVRKYHRAGLRVFAWGSVAILVLSGIGIVFLLLGVADASADETLITTGKNSTNALLKTTKPGRETTTPVAQSSDDVEDIEKSAVKSPLKTSTAKNTFESSSKMNRNTDDKKSTKKPLSKVKPEQKEEDQLSAFLLAAAFAYMVAFVITLVIAKFTFQLIRLIEAYHSSATGTVNI